MKIRSRLLSIIIIAAFVVGIGGSMITGWWKTEGRKVPVKYSSGTHAGISNPADIRGSYAFSDIAASFDVTAELLGRAFGLTGVNNISAVQANDLESIYGEVEDGEIGTDSVRLFVARYLGLPYTPEEGTLLPNQAVQILSEKLSDDELADVKERAVSIAGLKDASTMNIEHTESVEEQWVKGKTTFGDLRKWGLSDEDIEKTLGFKPGKDGETVRDACLSEGIEFGVIKAKLQEVVDSQ